MATLLSRAWSERGHEVILCPTFSQRGAVDYPVGKKVELVFLADLVAPRTGRLGRLLRLRRLMRERRPDVIVSFLSNVNLAAILAARGLGIPVVISERNHPPAVTPQPSRAFRAARRMLYPRADAIVALTGRTRDWLAERIPRTPVTVLPNPVVLPLPEAEPRVAPSDILPAERRVILAAGRLQPQKRFGIAIAAFARIAAAHPDLDLVLLGAGPERARLENLAAASGVAGRIHLPGFAGNPADWYARSEMFVLTSAHEGFPNLLLEAMAHGLPTISFDVETGPRDMTDDGRRGVLLPDRDHVPALAGAMARLAADETERQRLAAAGAEVREVYGESGILALWDALFDRLRLDGAAR